RSGRAPDAVREPQGPALEEPLGPVPLRARPPRRAGLARRRADPNGLLPARHVAELLGLVPDLRRPEDRRVRRPARPHPGLRARRRGGAGPMTDAMSNAAD